MSAAPVKTGAAIAKIAGKQKLGIGKKILVTSKKERNDIAIACATVTQPQKIGLATLSSVTAEFTTYPLDFVKTRLQIQGEFGSNINGQHLSLDSKQRSLGRLVFKEIRDSRSLRPFYLGSSAAVLRHSIYSGLRMPLYEICRDSMKSFNKTSDITVVQAVILAGGCGAFSQWLITPTDLIKTRMQSGQASSVAGAVKHLYRSGVVKCWTGATPNVYRAILTNQGDLMTYDRVKQGLLKYGYNDGFKVRFMASFCASLIATLFSMPFDTIKIRLMSQCVENPTYSGVFNCGVNMVKQEGFRSLYRGFLPAWSRQVIWTQVFWQTNESLREFCGFKAF